MNLINTLILGVTSPAKRPDISDACTNTDCTLNTPKPKKTCSASSQTNNIIPAACKICEDKTIPNDIDADKVDSDDERYRLPPPRPFPGMLPLFESVPKNPKVLKLKSNLKKRDKSVDENRLPQLPRALHEGLHYFHIEIEGTGRRSNKILACGVKRIQPVIETVVKQPKHVRFNLNNDYPHGYHTDEKRFDYHGQNNKEHHMNEWTSYRDICAV